MNYNTKCLECGSEVVSDYKGFCDIKCHGKYYGRKSMEIDYGLGNCKTCNKEFQKKSTNHLYCSDECKHQKPKHYCKKCGIKLDSYKKHCLNCKNEIKRKIKREYRKNIQKECIRCGSLFKTYHKPQTYCSMECRYITKECVSCGNTFKTENENKQHCSFQCMNNAKKKSHFEFTNELVMKHQGMIVPLEEYKGSDHKIKCKCLKCGNEMEKIARFYIGNRGSGCTNCRNRSYGEESIEKWLADNKIEYKRQYSFDDLVYSGKLFYDFALLDNEQPKMLIEYDGEQHFKPVEAWGGEESLQETIVRDEIKNNYADEIDIPLLRINYKDKKNIESILTREISKYKLIKQASLS